jgi:hypothetical protein
MGRLPDGAPIAWVLGPDQKFVEVKPPHARTPLGCSDCGACDEDDDTEDGILLHKDGTHICVICGSPIESEDVTILLTKWMHPRGQKNSYPLVGGSRFAHFSCGVLDTIDDRRMEDQRIRALQRVDKRLSSKMWVRSHQKFRSLLMEETGKLLAEEKERNSERSRLLRSYQRAERRSRKEDDR